MSRASLVALTVLALLLRVYRIADYTVFQGDQGIDALAARALVVDGVVPFEGPATSAGGVHLGPLYYYLLALPMVFGSFDPLVQAVLVAVLGALGVGLVYWLLGVWCGFVPAVVGAGLYAVSPAAIVASRSAWNPTPAPFFLLLALCGLSLFHRSGNGRWLLLVGFGLGCLIQLHYFTVGAVLVMFGFALYSTLRAGQPQWTLAAVAVFVTLLLPFALHELLSGFPNVQAARALASSAPAAIGSLPRRAYEVLVLGLVGGFAAGGIEPLAVVLTVVVALGLVVARRSYFTLLLVAVLGATLLQALLYRGPIFEHYFVPLAPLVFLALGAASASVHRVALVPAAGLLALSLWQSPLRGEPLWHVARTESVAAAIAAHANQQPFAVWLFSADDKDGAYRYQLARLDLTPTTPDEALPAQLFVICQQEACDPADLQHSAGADWATATQTWQATFYGVTVLELSARSR